ASSPSTAAVMNICARPHRMIGFLLQIISQALLERLRRAEEERLHCPLGATEGIRDVPVGEAVDPREEQRGALLGWELADRDLELAGEFPGGGTLLRIHRLRVPKLR